MLPTWSGSLGCSGSPAHTCRAAGDAQPRLPLSSLLSRHWQSWRGCARFRAPHLPGCQSREGSGSQLNSLLLTNRHSMCLRLLHFPNTIKTFTPTAFCHSKPLGIAV